MNKKTARAIAESNITVGQVKAMLQKAYEAGAASGSRSRVNPGLSRAIAFNIFWEAYEKEGDDHIIRGIGDVLGATNALREFGEYWDGVMPQGKPRRKLPDEYAHEEAINIHEEMT